MRVLGIDPGTTHSGYAVVQRGKPDHCLLDAGKVANDVLLAEILPRWWRNSSLGLELAVESMQSYGHTVGTSVFEACYMIGRVQQTAVELGLLCSLYPRPTYSLALIGGGRKYSDALLRKALALRFGGYNQGQPLHALKGASDMRSAFGLAVFHLDQTGQQLFIGGRYAQ